MCIAALRSMYREMGKSQVIRSAVNAESIREEQPRFAFFNEKTLFKVINKVSIENIRKGTRCF